MSEDRSWKDGGMERLLRLESRRELGIDGEKARKVNEYATYGLAPLPLLSQCQQTFAWSKYLRQGTYAGSLGVVFAALAHGVPAVHHWWRTRRVLARGGSWGHC